MELKEYQEKMLKVLKDEKSLILNADTGLGKGYFISYTLAKDTLAYTLANNTETSIVVAPPHILDDWYNKLNVVHKLDNSKINIIDKKDKKIHINKVNLISYQKLIRYGKELSTIREMSYIILDEGHYIKNFKPSKSKTFVTLRSLMRSNKIKIKYKVVMSATLVVNSRADLFSALWLTDNTFYNKYPKGWYFFDGFEVEKVRTPYGIIEKIVGIKDYHYDLYFRPKIHKVTYESAGIERPERIIKDVYYKVNRTVLKSMRELENLKDTLSVESYDDLHAVKQEELKNMMQNPFAKMQQLLNGFIYLYDNNILEEDHDDLTYKQILAKAKTIKDYSKSKRDITKSVIDNETAKGNKGLLVYYYKAELESLKKVLGSKVHYHNRNINIFKQIEDFEKSDNNLYVANIKSLGTGVRFKNTQYLIEYSKHYNYGDLIQTRGRLEYVGGSSYVIYNISPNIDNLLTDLHKNILNKQKEVANV